MQTTTTSRRVMGVYKLVALLALTTIPSITEAFFFGGKVLPSSASINPSNRQFQPHGIRQAPLSSPSLLGQNVVLSPRQREERELEEADTQRAYGTIAKKFSEKVLEKAPEDKISFLRPQLERLSKKASKAVTEQELRPLLEKMAGLIDHKVWYVTEKGDLEVVPRILEVEEREIKDMQAYMDAGNFTAALGIYQGRYKRFARNPPPPVQTTLVFQALYETKRVNQTVVLYNYWYNMKNQGQTMEARSLYWVIKSFLSVGRMDMAVDVFRSHPRFDVLPLAGTLDLLLREAMNRELYEMASELLEATHLGGFKLDAPLVHELVENLLDQQCLDHAARAMKILLQKCIPIDHRVGTYFKNYMVKNGRMHLAYLHLTDPRLTHSTFRASANGYNMLLWRMCRLFMRMRDSVMAEPATGAGAGAAAASTASQSPVATKNELRGLTLRIGRVVAMMNRYGYRVTPQSGAMLQDVAAATSEFGLFRVLEDKLKMMERSNDEPDFGL